MRSINKYLCCSNDLTLATRLIAFIGISVSVLLTTVLLNDTSFRDYAISRHVALAFGLDWRLFHRNATSHSYNVDPTGKMISAIMIFYSVVFFLINVALLFASIAKSRLFACLWLICELLGCLSKLAALMYHLIVELDEMSNIFIGGSLIYIIVMIWWWMVVFGAQSSWKSQKIAHFELNELTNEGQDKSDSLILNSPKNGVHLLQHYLPFRSEESQDL